MGKGPITRHIIVGLDKMEAKWLPLFENYLLRYVSLGSDPLPDPIVEDDFAD
jgi:hypothetical protein